MNDSEDTPESDHNLVSQAQKGDTEAYDLLMLRHQDAIAAQMRRFSPSREVVEDLTQTVFIEAYQSLASFKPVAPFLHWLRIIASRVGYRYWRKEERRVKLIPYHGYEEFFAEKDDTAGTDTERKFAKMVEFMERLKPDERQILYLLHVDNVSIADAAECMGWNRAVTKMRAFRARRKLRELLKREGRDF